MKILLLDKPGGHDLHLEHEASREDYLGLDAIGESSAAALGKMDGRQLPRLRTSIGRDHTNGREIAEGASGGGSMSSRTKTSSVE
jgi:hypothetical protein